MSITVLTETLLTCFSLECKGNVNIAKGKGLYIIVLYENVKSALTKFPIPWISTTNSTVVYLMFDYIV